MATNFPTEGDDLKISLRNSQYPQFDRAFGEMLREDHRDIWAAGGNIRGNEAFTLWGRARDGEETDGVLDWIKEREAWAARHFDDGAQFSGGDESPNLSNIAGVVAQIKWGVIGNLGEARMKEVVREVIDKREERESVSLDSSGYTAEQESEVSDMEQRHIKDIAETDDEIIITYAKVEDESPAEEAIEEALEEVRLQKTDIQHRAEHGEMEQVDDRRVRMSI